MSLTNNEIARKIVNDVLQWPGDGFSETRLVARLAAYLNTDFKHDYASVENQDQAARLEDTAQESTAMFQPESDNKMVALVAKRLIETFLGTQIAILRRVATRRIEWSSPFYWTVLDSDDGSHFIAMRYNNETNRWFVERGTSQEWSFAWEDK
jgi:hypothetical protein